MKKNTKKNNSTIKKDTKALRLINWVFSLVLILGSLIILFMASQIGALYVLLFLTLVITSYTMPAILLYSGVSKLFGIPIILDKKNKILYKISLAANFLFLLIGVGIILASVYLGQYIIVILGFIITLLSSSNVKALDVTIKALEN